MCGIAAIYGTGLSPASKRGLIKQMVSSLRHRGPDGWGYYISSEIALGQSRLSIVDLKSGDQPMVSGDLVIIYNGEIFNYLELKAELTSFGISFKTTCDTEVLLKAYEYWGFECFSKLNGQFSVLIWNRKTKELLVARDRFAIRPLYILTHKDSLYFASEMKAFDQIPDFRREFNVGQLYRHGLMWNTIADSTIYNHIQSLPGGSYAIYSEGKKIKQSKYYELGLNSSDSKKLSLGESMEIFQSLMDDAVKLQLRSDVPVGAYLSGGIDSSVILHLISKHTTNRFKSFSVSFEDQEFDESNYQREMINTLNSENFSLRVTYDMIDEAFPEAVYHFERPVFRTAPVPLFLLSKIVNENDIKVVLTGEGADEILWGYDSFKELKLLEFWAKYPDSKYRPLLIKSLYPHLNHYKDDQQYGMMRMFYEGFLSDYSNELASLNIRIHNNSILRNYFKDKDELNIDKSVLISEITPWLPENYQSFSLLQKNQFMELKTLLSGYLLSSQGDRMSLAHSVEGRYPFLDHRIIDFLFHLNENYKLNGFNQKHLLKKAYQDNIPPSIINRPKRPYMSPDLKSFFRDGKLTSNAGFFLSEDLIKDYGIFNFKWVERFVQKFKQGIPDNLGYRDNMIITFILSTQIANYWALNPRKEELSESLLTVSIHDN